MCRLTLVCGRKPFYYSILGFTPKRPLARAGACLWSCKVLVVRSLSVLYPTQTPRHTDVAPNASTVSPILSSLLLSSRTFPRHWSTWVGSLCAVFAWACLNTSKAPFEGCEDSESPSDLRRGACCTSAPGGRPYIHRLMSHGDVVGG